MELLSTEQTLEMRNYCLGPVTAEDVRGEAEDVGKSVAQYIADCVAEAETQGPLDHDRERVISSLCRAASAHRA